MGWSLSHIRPEQSEAASAALSAVGRALYLATAFESKCIHVLRLGLLAQAASGDPEKRLEELLGSVPDEQRLHRALEMLVKLPIVRDAEAPLLWRAKEARNHIAHKAAAYGPIFSVRDSTLANSMRTLREEVAHLAAGDNIVSTIQYEIEETERAPYEIVERYPAMIDAWVFESVEMEVP